MKTAGEVLEGNRAFYKACARNYDSGRQHSFRRERNRVVEDLLWFEGFFPLRGAVVLDVGCGTGFFGLVAAEQGADHIHCLDIEPLFLEQTRRRLAENHPRVRVTCHQSDLGAFVADRADLLPSIDIWIMGSVLQYVPECDALLAGVAELQRNRPGGFYITSTRRPSGQGWPRFERVLARCDYALHRLLHRSDRAQRGLPGTKVTLQVDPQQLERILGSQGFATRLQVYSAFHTLVFSGLHRIFRRLFPFLGTHFTLLAAKR